VNGGGGRHRRRRSQSGRIGRAGRLRRLVGGLSACAILLSALSLCLGAGAARASVDLPGTPVTIHVVASMPPIARTPGPDEAVAPIAALVLVVALGIVVVRTRPTAVPARGHCARPTGRGPPSAPTSF